MSVRLVPAECCRLAHFAKAQGLDVVALGEKISAPMIAGMLWRANCAAFHARYGHLQACADILRDTKLGYRKLRPDELTSVAATREALESFNYQIDDMPRDIAALSAAIHRRIDALEPPTIED